MWSYLLHWKDDVYVTDCYHKNLLLHRQNRCTFPKQLQHH